MSDALADGSGWVVAATEISGTNPNWSLLAEAVCAVVS